MQTQKEQGQRDWAGRSKLGQFYMKKSFCIHYFLPMVQWYDRDDLWLWCMAKKWKNQKNLYILVCG